MAAAGAGAGVWGRLGAVVGAKRAPRTGVGVERLLREQCGVWGMGRGGGKAGGSGDMAVGVGKARAGAEVRVSLAWAGAGFFDRPWEGARLWCPGSCSRCCPGAACTGGGPVSRRGGRPQASAVQAGCGPVGDAGSRPPCSGVGACNLSGSA